MLLSYLHLRQFLLLRRVVLLGCVVILAFSTPSQAGTIVRVSTSVGDYSIELLEESGTSYGSELSELRQTRRL